MLLDTALAVSFLVVDNGDSQEHHTTRCDNQLLLVGQPTYDLGIDGLDPY